MGCRSLGEARPADGFDHGALQHGFVQVMTAALARGAVAIDPGSREHPLPDPLRAGVWILTREGPRQLDPTGAAPQVGLMLALHPLQVLAEGGLGHGRQDGDAILGALPVADDDLVHREVDVLDAQAAAFEQAQPGAVERGAEPRRAPARGPGRRRSVSGWRPALGPPGPRPAAAA